MGQGGASSYTCQTSSSQLLGYSKASGVVLVDVVLVVADVDADAHIFSGRPHACILSLHFNQYFIIVLAESVDARSAVAVAVFIDSF